MRDRLRKQVEELPQNSVMVKDNAGKIHRILGTSSGRHSDERRVGLPGSGDIAHNAGLASRDPAMQWEIDVIDSLTHAGPRTRALRGKRDLCIDKVRELPTTLQIVKLQDEMRTSCMDPTFWEEATEEELEDVIDRMGPLMRHRDPTLTPFRILDLTDDIVVRAWMDLEGRKVKKTAYKDALADFVTSLSTRSEAVRKIRDGQDVTDEELDEIEQLFEDFEHPVDAERLREAWGAKRVSLRDFLASILRGDDLPDWGTRVRGAFESHIQENSTYNPRQIQMLDVLCNYVIDNEAVSKADLVAAPFTQFDRKGFLGVFKPDQINEILSFTEALSA